MAGNVGAAQGAGALLPTWTDAETAIKAIGRHLGVLPNGDERNMDVSVWAGLVDVVLALVDTEVLEMRGSPESGFEFRGTNGGMMYLAYEQPVRADLLLPWSRSAENGRPPTEPLGAVEQLSETAHEAMEEATSSRLERERNLAVCRAEAAEAARARAAQDRDAQASRVAELEQELTACRAERDQALHVAQDNVTGLANALRREAELQRDVGRLEVSAEQLHAERDDALWRAERAEQLLQRLKTGEGAGNGRAASLPPPLDHHRGGDDGDGSANGAGPANGDGWSKAGSYSAQVDVRKLWRDRRRHTEVLRREGGVE